MLGTPIQRKLKPALRALAISARPLATVSTLVATDLIALTVSAVSSVWVRLWLGGSYHPSLYWQIWPLLGLFVLGYSIVGLYAGVALSPADELRRTSVTTTLIYVVLGTATFLLRNTTVYSRGVFLMAWLLTLVLVPLTRGLVRQICAPQPWWGYPVLVLGAGKTGSMVIETLKARPEIGLKPVAILDDDPSKRGSLKGVPVIGPVSKAPELARRLNLTYAIVAMPGVSSARVVGILEKYGQLFRHILLIPNLFGFSTLWVMARDMGGVLGLEVRQQLLLPGPQLVKVCLTFFLTIVGGLMVLPLILLCGIAIKLDSRGPIFYGHTRIGKGGKLFKAWKFRSMYADGDRILEAYLEQYPEVREEWERDRKLKHDPRITRIGKWLRRTSLDELPQLWNVLLGEMSLVGPRPIIDEEVSLYGDKFDLYLKVLPGITGLWQVSGRSDTTYEERVELDEYYVRNWSVWLDIYILTKTIWVAIRAKGAY
ncbi:MAG: undecaprenyl-phosphate galactose phosphotransferase WbaP [Cyanobacteria bacterium P01_A01_bin.3]